MRHASTFILLLQIYVSIHAPTRGATARKTTESAAYLFQSTHPHGVRPCTTPARKETASFNPRTHTGCDAINTDIQAKRDGFQSTHPHGVRRWLHPPKARKTTVSIHAPTRGATLITKYYKIMDKFQSTHPHGVRRLGLIVDSERTRSFNPRTHTGCDIPSCFVHKIRKVSIHAPTRGATWQGTDKRRNTKSFNPRTHTGCDIPSYFVHKIRKVSIHAPTRGATAFCGSFLSRLLFQSTHPHGVRQMVLTLAAFLILFQSTHPHGVRHTLMLSRLTLSCFNPRTHTGCDRLEK